jgi:hypothetical protein
VLAWPLDVEGTRTKGVGWAWEVNVPVAACQCATWSAHAGCPEVYIVYDMNMNTKRPRAQAGTDDSDVFHEEPLFKSSRASSATPPPSNAKASTTGALIHRCTLPPTCAPPIGKPTTLSDAQALERHYATYHTHVCEEGSCRCVFPEARLLELVSSQRALSTDIYQQLEVASD